MKIDEVREKFGGWLERRRKEREAMEQYERDGGASEEITAAMGRTVTVKFPPSVEVDYRDDAGWTRIWPRRWW
jgi:hypothetical protein